MKKFTLLSLIICSSLAAATNEEATSKSHEEQKQQTSVRCVVDELLFLAPHLATDVAQLAGKVVLDAGLGSAQRTLNLCNLGAQICTLDEEEQIQELIPYANEIFDRALSVNIGSSLPSTVHIVCGDEFQIGGLGTHCCELARVLKAGAEATVVAPASYAVVFTNGSCSDETTLNHVQKVLDSISDIKDSKEIVAKLSDLDEVNRATFVEKMGHLTLVTDESELSMGKQIWRKEGKNIFPSYYHTVEEYLVAFNNAGLHCTEIKRPCFFGKVKFNLYHQGLEGDEGALGLGYIDNNPFTIYSVVKKMEAR